MNLATLLSIFLGGGFGALSRYGISNFFLRSASGQFPWGTLVANYLGCLLIGSLGFLAQQQVDTPWKPLLITGFLGALTTFSTFSLESLQLFRAGELRLALTYVAVSNVGGILLAGAGWFLTEKLST